MAWNIDTHFLLTFLTGLLNTPSPTGYHEKAIAYCREAFQKLGVDLSLTQKGALLIHLAGKSSDRPVGLTAHVDTLGAMVSRVKSNGRLELTMLGGWAWGSVEGEGVTILAHNGNEHRGTILPTHASVHIYGNDARDFKREASNYEIRLDLKTSSVAETEEAGISVGSFVFFDPRVEISPAGFIRSRHLDDKAGVACILAAIEAILSADLKPAQDTYILITNYEEVGHGGAAGFPAGLAEVLAVDMAAAGGDQNSDEFSVGICVKDSGGPYHIAMRNILIQLASVNGIPYKLDIYPHYGSDGEAYWRAGGEAVVGLIGPGVDASHHYERTHTDSLLATTRLIVEYLLAEE